MPRREDEVGLGNQVENEFHLVQQLVLGIQHAQGRGASIFSLVVGNFLSKSLSPSW